MKLKMTPLSKFGVGTTVVYLFGIASISGFNWADFSSLKPNEWGDFLAGAFGPLAIFWLVLGFFQQGHELRHSVEALKLQADELRHSVEQQKEMVRITEQQLNLDIEVRGEEKVAAAERDLPYFQLSEIQNRNLPTLSIAENHEYKITNYGSHASAVSLNSDGATSGIEPSYFASFPQNETKKIGVTIGLAFVRDRKLVITSRNHKNQERRQEFTVGRSGPTMSNCFPERN